jgi:hypothetical protein
MAASLAAQTLSFGEITLVTPATTPPTYNVNLVLSTANTQYSGLVAGLQFDLNYDPTSLKVTIGLGAQTANQQIDTVCLTNFTGCSTYAQFNPSSKVAQDSTAGQRAIVIGCCSQNQVNNSSQYPVTSNLISDGAVAVLTVQATSTPNNLTLTLPAAYLAATTAGGQNTAAQAIPLSVGKGSNDPNGTGQLSLKSIYLEGGISPMTSTSAGGFGSGQVKLADLILELLYETGAPGYTLPAACTDYFDAMDVSPADTATTRGGDGLVNLNDLILELLRETGAPGYSAFPVRTARGLACTSSVQSSVRPAPEVRGTLELGPTEGAGSSGERTPLYLRAGRDLARVAIAFSVGDEKSQLQFDAAAGMSPSLLYNSQPGFVAVAFLQGMDARAGNQTLLGYVVGPAGSGANLKVFGTQATGLNDLEVFGIDFGGRSVRR